MFERLAPVLRIICLTLAAVVVYQMLVLGLRGNPLANVKIPATLSSPGNAGASPNSAATNAPASVIKKEAALPGPVQARVERIRDSEIFGPVQRPLPMALLGIAGRDAFIRAPSGQTGLLREGDELGGVKLLQIGTNRVLIEHEGQKKELTIFSGFGSESLLLKGKETSP